MRLGQGLLLASLFFFTGVAAPQERTAQEERSAPAAAPTASTLAPERYRVAPPTELFEVVTVVDADTIHVQRGGKLEKLRLLCVDSEEKITGRASLSDSKPETLFGEECAQWARRFFGELGDPPRIGLLFPGGKEERDLYGRLLCHVILPDGTDFNVLLVETGKSPYFNKYGNSTVAHDAFVAAQARARAAHAGIWDPKANEPKTPGAPSAKRPYEQLLPWWDARAKAVEAFRARAAAEPLRCVAADDPAGLRRSLAWCAEDPNRTVEVFGAIERFFDEDDGSRTVLFASGSKTEALRARIPKDARGAMEALDLPGTTKEFRQNYLTVTGRLAEGARGFEIAAGAPSAWKTAGPEP